MEYAEAVTQDGLPSAPAEQDPNCLAHLKDYRSLMPMAQEAKRPMFLLKPADGAIGAHQQAVLDCYTDFRNLAEELVVAGIYSVISAAEDIERCAYLARHPYGDEPRCGAC